MKALGRRWLPELSGWFRDASGSTSLEFVFVFPFALYMVLGTIELALDMVVDASVEIAAQAASRVGLTTTVPVNESRAQQASAIVNTILGGWENLGGKVTIAELDYGTYGNVNTSSYSSSPGALGEIVSYNITLTMHGFTGIPALFGVPTLTFQRNYLVQNEQ
jgi:Flp pilus assembly protein TadG